MPLSPAIWPVLAGAFVLAGIAHLVRAGKGGPRAGARRLLAAACVAWAVAAVLVGYASVRAAIPPAVVGGLLMLAAAAVSARDEHPTAP